MKGSLPAPARRNVFRVAPIHDELLALLLFEAGDLGNGVLRPVFKNLEPLHL